jgi:signal transduction histidine kinase
LGINNGREVAVTDGQAHKSQPAAGDLDLEPDDAGERLPPAKLAPAIDGLHRLLGANRAILGELSLPAVLTRVVEAACDLGRARYGALGVIGPDGHLEQFIYVGMDAEQAAAMGELPQGHGLLGALIAHPEPIRLVDIACDPRSGGLPDHHPPMRSFLGVPIKLRDAVYGNLYLTESLGGEFTEQDSDLLVALAGSAAIAIENARLFDDARRRQAWLHASTDITRQLLTSPGHHALRDIAELVKTLADADVVTVVLPADDNQLKIDVATGDDEQELTGLRYPAHGTLSQAVIHTGEPVRLADAAATASDLTVHMTRVVPIGPVLALPLAGSGAPRGALLAGRRGGRPAFSLAELDMAATFAGHAAIALELADARAAQERLTLLEDRDRIARDLHDHVIQRLFAAGLTVQSVIRECPPGISDQLSRVVEDIDNTIRQIRASIFALQGAPDQQGSARGRLLRTVDTVAASMDQPPRVRFVGPVDTMMSADLVENVQAVLRESLTNVTRHARAHNVDVDMTVDNGCFRLDVIDNGVGIGTSTRRSGLANLRSRAEHLGGTFHVTPGVEKGTHLLWTVPLT